MLCHKGKEYIANSEKVVLCKPYKTHHEENTKEMNVQSMFVNRINICPDLHKLQL
jgi:hypothetical protein